MLTLAEGHSVTRMLAVAAVAILLTGMFYYRAFRTLRAYQWQLLLGLRITAILLVILLLFRPVYSYQNILTQKPSLVFLLDRSASMSISDDASGMTRFQQAQDKLNKWTEKLKNDFKITTVAFAEQPKVIETPQELAALKPDGKATSLLRGLSAASKQYPPSEVTAIILLSDGIHNSAGNPLDIVSKMGVVTHSIGVGASLRSNVSYRDIQVTGIDCPERLPLNNIARITGSIDAIGLGGRVVTAFLDEDGKEIAQKELTLDDTEGAQQVTFEFRPTVKGRHTYQVRVPAVGEEKIVENNQRSIVSMVIEPGMKVLYIEGTLRAEYGALVDRFLAKDPDLEFFAMIQTRTNLFLKRTNMTNLKLNAIPSDQETIDKFDVFIFGDIDSSFIKPQQQEMFVKRIRNGAGLLMLGGYHSLGPGGYAGTPIGDVLPVILGDRQIGQVTDSFLPTLTPNGAHHPIFTNIATFFPTAQGPAKTIGLPQLDGCTKVERAKPGANVLATFPGETAMPVLAIQPVDRGRTAIFTGDTTRKWQQAPKAMNQESPYLRFWGQMVRWLAGRGDNVETQASISATTDKAYYEPGEPIHISAIVRDKEGQGANNAKVSARIRDPKDHTERAVLTPVAGPGGHYGGAVEPQIAGNYEIVVEARLGETNLKADKIPLEVGRPNLEYEKLDLNEKMLDKIASETGGRYLSLSTADHLIDQLDHKQRKKTEYIERQLSWPPGFWALFVIVLTAEWILRKKYQLR
jgi:uncharacterized membrane protein